MQAFGEVLRDWRQRRRRSQLDLGLSAGVSARHISFLETGRAGPSRGMVLRLGAELEMPPAACNQMLAAAGMTPAFSQQDLSAEEMAPLREAVDWMLSRHAPYPAMVLDRHWTMQALNTPAEVLLGAVGLGTGDNLVEAILENPQVRSSIENLREVGRHLVMRLRTELLHYGEDAWFSEMIARLEAEFVEENAAPQTLPTVIPTRYRFGDTTLSLFSTIAQFGSTGAIAAAELRLEFLFPADDATRWFLESQSG